MNPEQFSQTETGADDRLEKEITWVREVVKEFKNKGIKTSDIEEHLLKLEKEMEKLKK